MNIKPDTDANQDICIGLLLFGVAVLNVLKFGKKAEAFISGLPCQIHQ